MINYLVVINCKDPSKAEFFMLMDDENNDVHINKRSADNLARELNDAEGDGYARVIAI